MADADAKLVIGADASQLNAEVAKAEERVATGFQHMSKEVAEFAAQTREQTLKIQEHFKGMHESINSAFEKVQASMLALTAVMAGTGAIKEFVQDSMEITKSAIGMGRALGISATDASYLNVALKASGVATEDYLNAATKIDRTLSKNESAFADLGVATRDANGNLLSTREIMDSTNAKLREFQEGTDRNVEGMKIYGKAWSEIAPLISKFKGESEETREEAESLNLVVGQEAVTALAQYRQAHVGASEVMEGVSNTIGQALMPGLTNMANWFRSVGPQVVEMTRAAMETFSVVTGAVSDSIAALWAVVSADFAMIGKTIAAVFGSGGEGITAMEVFKNVLKVIEVAFIGLRVSVQLVGAIVLGVLRQISSMASTAGAVITAALRGDWAGVKAAYTKGGEEYAAGLQKTMDDAVAIAVKGRADIDTALMANLGAQKKVTPTAPPKNGKRSSEAESDDGKESSMVSQWETQLKEWEVIQQEKAQAEGKFFQISAQQEADYWKLALQQTEAGTAENLAVRAKVAEAEKKILQERFDTEAAGYKAGEAAALGNLSAKMAYAQAELNIVRQMYGEQSKQATEAAAHVEANQVEQAKQARELAGLVGSAQRAAALADIDMQERATKSAYDLKKINADQMLEIDQAYEDKRFAIKLKAAQDELALTDPRNDPVEYQKLMNQIEAIKQQHEAKMQELTLATVKADDSLWSGMFKGIDGSFAQLALNFTQGTLTIKNLFADLAKSILDNMSKMFINMGVQWATQNANDLAATITANVGKAQSFAGVAGASGVASMAAAPFPISLGAPAFGASMMGVASSFAAMASAAGGFDIPAGVNPVTQLHQKEMVLPAEHADTIRGMAGAGGQAMQIHIHAADARSFKSMLENNSGVLRDLMRAQMRNFAT